MEGEGFQVESATDGIKALELFKSKSFDLIITDIRMPNMDGSVLIREIKKLDYEQEIIVLTGFATLDNAIQVLKEGGAFDYISKPLEDIDSFINTINNAIFRHKLRLEKKNLIAQLKVKKKELQENVEQLSNEIKERKKIEYALKKSEKRYREIVEETSDLVTRVDADGNFRYMNPVAERIFGISAEKCLGKSAFDFIHPDDQERTKAEFAKWKNMHRRCAKVENRQVNQVDGTSCDMMWSCNFQYDKNKNMVGINGIAHDLTEHKKLLEVTIRNRNLESLGAFAGGIAHDYNNLMYVIMGNISLASEELKLDSDANKYLLSAEKACRKSTKLTTQLLTFSSGGNPVKELTNICKLLTYAVNSVLVGSNVNPEFSISKTLQKVNIDAKQIQQVVQNIVVNAQESMNHNGTIKISCNDCIINSGNNKGLRKGSYNKVVIEDHGKGIPEQNILRIFDPYFTTKKMGTDKGQGLGLTICNSIVEKHAGKITISSKIGKGSKFSIFLPVSKKVSEIESRKKKGITKKKNGQCNVLVMDDEEMILDFLCLALERLGHDFKTCVEGGQAIELYKKSMNSDKPFDAVLLDLSNQVGMGGKEAMSKLKEIDPAIRGIVCTGYSNDPVVKNCREYGFVSALLKPCTIEQLAKKIDEAISKE